jgi:hypothetical protein
MELLCNTTYLTLLHMYLYILSSWLWYFLSDFLHHYDLRFSIELVLS